MFVSILTKPTLLVVLILFVAGRFYIWSKLPPSFELKIIPLGCQKKLKTIITPDTWKV